MNPVPILCAGCEALAARGYEVAFTANTPAVAPAAVLVAAVIGQMGVVDEVTLSSIVVRSDDGYSVEAARTGATKTLNRFAEGPAHGN